MTAIFSPNSYNRGVELANPDDPYNVLPDGDFEEEGGDDGFPSSGIYSAFPDQWSIISFATGTGGTVFAGKKATTPLTGTRHLQLSATTAGSPDNYVQIKSPHFDVTPGATYVMTWNYGQIASTPRTGSYVRIGGGSTDAMSQYPANTYATSIATHAVLTYENTTPPSLGTATPGNASKYEMHCQIFTVPAGITRCFVRILLWKPTGSTQHLYDNIRIVKLNRFDNTGLDTGWDPIRLTDEANFAPYATGTDPMVRRVNNMVYVTGSLALQTAGYIDTPTSRVAGTLPHPIFRPYAPNAAEGPVWIMQSSSNNHYAMRIMNGSDVVIHRYGPGASVVNTWLPMHASWMVP